MENDVSSSLLFSNKATDPAKPNLACTEDTDGQFGSVLDLDYYWICIKEIILADFYFKALQK